MSNILWGALFVIGGLSGRLVLRGTNSSKALIFVGIGLIILGLFRVLSRNKNENIKTVEVDESLTREKLDSPCSIIIKRKSNFVGALNSYTMYLNNQPIGKLKNGSIIESETNYKKNILSFSEMPKKFYFEVLSNNVEIQFIRMTNEKGQNLEIISGAKELDSIE